MAWRPSDYPEQPGCYLFRDADGGILYIGKAVNLRQRLTAHGATPRTAAVATVDVIVTRNETEALLLESNLVKQHRPPWNKMLVDDEDGYFSIVLTGEALPRLLPFRSFRANSHLRGVHIVKTFGPYVSWRHRDELLRFVVDRFGLRTCEPVPDAVCLRFDLGACGGVCAGHVDHAAYARAVDAAEAFLDAPPADAVDEVKAKMAAAAGQLNFEYAARLKLLVDALEATRQPQVVDRERDIDEAVVCTTEDRQHAFVMLFRRGRLTKWGFIQGDKVPDGVAGWGVQRVITRAESPTDDELIELARLNLAAEQSRWMQLGWPPELGL